MSDWSKNLQSFIQQYSLHFKSAVLVGSLVYGATFKETSDIDLIILLRNEDEWDKACNFFLHHANNSAFIQQTKELYRTQKGDYFCLKFKHAEIMYSIDFIPISFFDKAIQDFKNKTSVIYHKITNQPQTNNYEFGSAEHRITIPKENYTYSHCTTVSSPLFIIKDTVCYLGILLDKLLTGYSSIWGPEEVFQKFISIGIQKMFSENKFSDPASIMRSVNRYSQLQKEYILQQTIKIRSLF
ncbi:MAG: nucleotidyltransferase domain-containing protein [Candidatus Woesearchaeota archaeon]|nr:nucleotidyltransferase domain-containing protein [Candidatus Woesearchaeota archaeon]